MNETIDTTVEVTTLGDVCRSCGLITSSLSGLALVTILIMAVIGIVRRIKSHDNNISWWIIRISLALFFLGIAGFANDVIHFYVKIPNHVISRAIPEFYGAICEATYKICITSSVAFIGIVACLIVGPEKNNKNANNRILHDGVPPTPES
jgi:hypothetical protein